MMGNLPSNSVENKADVEDTIRKVLRYDEGTGELIYVLARPRKPVGSIVSRTTDAGYLEVRFHRRQFMAHRVAWLLHYGKWPEGDVDHIDGNKTNNRLSNLRLATPSQNQANQPVRRNSPHSAKGVRLESRTGRWMARIVKNGVCRSLGGHETKAQAMAAYARAAADLYGEYGRAQ